VDHFVVELDHLVEVVMVVAAAEAAREAAHLQVHSSSKNLFLLVSQTDYPILSSILSSHPSALFVSLVTEYLCRAPNDPFVLALAL